MGLSSLLLDDDTDDIDDDGDTDVELLDVVDDDADGNGSISNADTRAFGTGPV